MVNFPGRTGRRRRVLNEEVLSASTSHTALRSISPEDDVRDAPRYSDAAGVEHHPQVTDFIPRRHRSIAVFVLCGVMTTAVLTLLRYYGAPIAGLLGLGDSSAFRTALDGRIAAWVQAVVLLLASVVCWLVYSIRRHRIDDIRGRYRIWLAAAVAAVVMSGDSVTAIHQVVADALSQLSGWNALRDGAVWWLIAGGLPVMWIVTRTLLDVRECRLAAALATSGAVCYVAGTAAYLGVLPTSDTQLAETASTAAVLLGHWLVCAAAITNARYVILDAQGLIAHRSHDEVDVSSTTDADSGLADVVAMPKVERKNQRRLRDTERDTDAAASSDSHWVDGSRPERLSYREENDEEAVGDDRKLSKADLKRMRKFKTQSRAA